MLGLKWGMTCVSRSLSLSLPPLLSHVWGFLLEKKNSFTTICMHFILCRRGMGTRAPQDCCEDEWGVRVYFSYNQLSSASGNLGNTKSPKVLFGLLQGDFAKQRVVSSSLRATDLDPFWGSCHIGVNFRYSPVVEERNSVSPLSL